MQDDLIKRGGNALTVLHALPIYAHAQILHTPDAYCKKLNRNFFAVWPNSWIRQLRLRPKIPKGQLVSLGNGYY